MKDKEFNVTKPLPKELLITSAGSDLHPIGLSHFRNGSQFRNNKWFIHMQRTHSSVRGVIFKWTPHT